MIDYRNELNDEQREVVLHGDGPCLVLAGAGSGKTRTITYRVAYLLEQGIEPDRILLVTFTNKAAKEMIDRVALLTRGAKRLPWSGTFHHIGFRLLKKYAPLLGYAQNFTILDSEDSRDLIKLCLKQEGIDRKERRFPSPQVVQSIVSYARNAQTTIRDVVDLKHERFLDVVETLERIADDYAKRKREANAMDFDDLLVNLHLLLLKNERVREKLAEQFQYVLVDEYQDTNKVQASIIRLLSSAHNNILVVGDDAQSIYSFRAADIENILAFEKHYPGARVFRLEINYRSTPEILALANDVIAQNVRQYDKELKSVKRGFAKPEVQAFADQREEAEWIAERILELEDEGVAFCRMAVLFRAAFHSQALEMELSKRDIPYEFRGGVRFFERAHIKDVLAYLRIVNNLSDSMAWMRVLTMQVGIGPSGAQAILAGLAELESVDEISHLGASLPARASRGWSDFLQVWEEMNKSEKRTPALLIRAVMRSKYQEYLENEYPDYRERLQDLEQLAVFGERTDDLNQFLAEASLHESFAAAHVQEEQGREDKEKLVLSTIHQAKGLEWDAVFILNMAAGAFPSEMSVREPNGIEEERRLFYVALTRAERLLHITYPLTGFGAAVLTGPSMFLEDMDTALVEQTALRPALFFDPSDDEDDITYEPEDDARPKSFLKSVNEL